jgi:MFS family permease
VATAIFSLPFLIFAAPAGWMADRFPKRTIVIVAKFLELAAMICGAVGVCTGNFTLVLLMLAVMGLQATIFSPALNGAIAEIYPAKQVLKANAILRTVVTANILLGVVLAGFALAAHGGSIHGIERGKALVAAAVIAVSLLGILASLGVPRLPAASPGVRFPWTGPLDTARELYRVRKDALLAITMITDTFVWFGGSVQVLLINKLGMDQFQLKEALTSKLVAAELVGFAIGGGISSKAASGARWQRVLPPSALFMGAFMLAMAWIPSLPEARQLTALFVTVGLIGAAGGMIMVPCESFIQVRPPAARKGAVIAAANFAAFSGVLLSGPAANLLNAHWKPTSGFACLGGISCLVGLGLLGALAWRQKADASAPPSLSVLESSQGRSSEPGDGTEGEP